MKTQWICYKCKHSNEPEAPHCWFCDSKQSEVAKPNTDFLYGIAEMPKKKKDDKK